MGWTERRLKGHFAAELSGQRLDADLPQSERDAVYQTVIREGVVVVRGQDLTDDELEAFAASLGMVMSYPGLGDHIPNVVALGNIGPDGKLLPQDGDFMRASLANMLWHIDSTYTRPRSTVSMLLGRIVPPTGGETEFCDLRHAWDRLSPDEQARFQGMTAGHSIIHSRTLTGYSEWGEGVRERLPTIDRPLVRDHEETGRTALLIASHIESLTGLSGEEAVALVAELTERAATSDNVYAHAWRPGDLLLWDNRCVMHRATDFDMGKYPRDVRSTRLVDVAELEAAE
jgi:alpha-ketoglutarate-dependent 2,4-dichlorophenoxyacetate dioxygenase